MFYWSTSLEDFSLSFAGWNANHRGLSSVLHLRTAGSRYLLLLLVLIVKNHGSTLKANNCVFCLIFSSNYSWQSKPKRPVARLNYLTAISSVVQNNSSHLMPLYDNNCVFYRNSRAVWGYRRRPRSRSDGLDRNESECTDRRWTGTTGSTPRPPVSWMVRLFYDAEIKV